MRHHQHFTLPLRRPPARHVYKKNLCVILEALPKPPNCLALVTRPLLLRPALHSPFRRLHRMEHVL